MKAFHTIIILLTVIPGFLNVKSMAKQQEKSIPAIVGLIAVTVLSALTLLFADYLNYLF